MSDDDRLSERDAITLRACCNCRNCTHGRWTECATVRRVERIVADRVAQARAEGAAKEVRAIAVQCCHNDHVPLHAHADRIDPRHDSEGGACTCECSPPEFGGNLPDRECPLHGEGHDSEGGRGEAGGDT